MKNFISAILVAVACVCTATFTFAENRATLTSPDGSTQVTVLDTDGKVYYQVAHKGKPYVGSSRLGLRTNAFDFTELELNVSDTFRITVPDVLPQISLTSGKTRSLTSDNVKAIEIKESTVNKITESR